MASRAKRPESGDLWTVELPDSGSHSQSGVRPALVVGSHETPLIFVIPFTANRRALRFPFTCPVSTTLLSTESVALVFQLRPIDSAYFVKRIGTIENAHAARILSVLEEMLH